MVLFPMGTFFFLCHSPQQPFFVYLFFFSILLYCTNTKDSAGITTFEIEYGNWVEEQNRQIRALRNALNADVPDMKLRILVENCRHHYIELFRMKETAAKADVFYVSSGMWKTSAERFFSWIGGIRPSELLKVTCGSSQINVGNMHFSIHMSN